MRSSTHQRSPRSESSFPWIWVIIIGAIFGIILLNSIFSGKTTTSTGGSFLTVSPGSGSEVYIKPASGSSKQITDVEDLYTTDTSLSISNGFAHVASTFIDGYLDKSSEMVYTAHATDGEKIEFTRGRLWIESHGNNIVQMKNIDITLKDGDIVMAEQPNQIFSTLYVLRGNIMISAGTMTSTLSAGKKIMVSKSDLANP